MNNIGNYILLVMIFLNLICLISFLVKGYKLLIKTIYGLVEQKMNIVKIKNVETTNRLITRNRKKDKDKLINKLSANIAQKTKINKYGKIKSINIKKNKKIKKIEINSNKLNNKYQKNKKIINTKIKFKKIKSKNIIIQSILILKNQIIRIKKQLIIIIHL